jgi:thiol-disulfide isomerase/thioredoxin
VPVDSPAALANQLDEALRPASEDLGVAVVHAPDLPTDPGLWLNTQAPMDLQMLRGQVVVLDFWTDCCINCVHMQPTLRAVEDRFAGQPVVVIGVHSAKFDDEKTVEHVRGAIARHRIRHPVLMDSDHSVWQAYAVRSWPTVVVIDPRGRIAWQQSGEVSPEVLGRTVQAVLDGAARDDRLAPPLWEAEGVLPPPGGLHFPGKLHIWPPNSPTIDERVRVYVSDTGHDQVVEYGVRLDQGRPMLTELRRFGGFNAPQGLARWENRLYVADTGNHQLKVVELSDGAVRAVAGSGRLGAGSIPPGDAPLELDLRSPWDVEISGDGDSHVVMVAMAGAHQIWVYSPDLKRMTPLAGSGREAHMDGPFGEAALAQPSGLVLHGPYVFFADSEVSSVRALDLQERVVGTLVGAGLFDFGDVDGVGGEVRLQHPMDVCASGNSVYVADTYNHKIKVIDLHDNSCLTLGGGSGELREPSGLDRLADFLLVADTGHHRVVALPLAGGATHPVS